MRTALVLGANGQDGSYLAEVLIARGYAVTGAGRQANSRWVDPSRFRYTVLDVRDTAALDALLVELRPDEIYHMAAVHGSAGYAYEAGWRDVLTVNVSSVHTCLEHMRTRSPQTRLFYPSSVKAFGAHPPERIDETTPRVSDCLYSITKNAAAELIDYYRTQHRAWACVGYYFNHDSPRRPDSYFLPRLVASLAAQLGKSNKAPGIATLDFWCDWGSSREFMELTADLLRADRPTDVIIATGVPTYAAQLANELAAAAGLAPASALDPSSKPPFRADIGKLRDVVSRAPRQRGFDVASWILHERYGISLLAPKGP
jgi:GDPmannose 4,6-dehydratase